MSVPPWVSHDRLDDEVMVINLKTGAYFAFDGAAADAWTMLAAGHGAVTTGALLADRYDVAAPVATADVARFADELRTETLLGPDDAGEPPSPVDLPPRELRPAYAAPSIDKYEDLQDLLLLDPIHEVEEAGWPAGRPE